MQHVRAVHPWLDRNRALAAIQTGEAIAEPQDQGTPARRRFAYGFYAGFATGLISGGVIMAAIAAYVHFYGMPL